MRTRIIEPTLFSRNSIVDPTRSWNSMAQQVEHGVLLGVSYTRTTLVNEPIENQESTPIITPKIVEEDAVTLEAIDGVNNLQYLRAIAGLVEPSSIMGICTDSNGIIRVYLNNKNNAEKLKSAGELTVKNERVRIKPLLTQTKRIVFANVPPKIRSNAIQKELNKIDVKLWSKINTVKIETGEPEFSHVLSCEREAYIDPIDLEKIPAAITVTQNGTKYRIPVICRV